MKKKSIKLLIVLILVIESFGFNAHSQGVDRTQLNYVISKAWETDSCGSLNLRLSIAVFFNETGYLTGMPMDSLILLLGLPDYKYTTKDGEMIVSYVLSCLEDDTGNCIKEEGSNQGYLKVFVDKKTLRSKSVVVINE